MTLIARAILLPLLALALVRCAAGNVDGLATGSSAPQPTMAGRWMLAAPNAPPCGLEFRASSAGNGGSLTPDGGCPGQFYKSRRWTLEDGKLAIKTDGDEILARLDFTDGHFRGSSDAGQDVTLVRNVPPNQVR